MDNVFVLRRNDTGQYYKGPVSYIFEKRWDRNLKKAKKYKRSADAVNAAKCMIPNSHWIKPEEMWMTKAGAFSVMEFEMKLLSERTLGSNANSKDCIVDISNNHNLRSF